MRQFRTLIFIVFLSFLAAPAVAGSSPVYTSWRDNIAVGGYDVVSFYSGKPVRGDQALSLDFRGATWRFSTRANLDLFRTNPDAFTPQYGGYCAWAVANGKLAKGSPKYWHVRDGKLYLNFNGRIQERWNRDIPGFIAQGDARWPMILDN